MTTDFRVRTRTAWASSGARGRRSGRADAARVQNFPISGIPMLAVRGARSGLIKWAAADSEQEPEAPPRRRCQGDPGGGARGSDGSS